METSNRLEAGGEEAENKKAEEPKTDQMVRKKMIILSSLACGTLAFLLWGILRFPRKFGISKIFKDKSCSLDLNKCPQGWNRIHKYCFLLSEYETSWSNSQESCKIYYASLAKFNFPKEMETLMQMLKPPSTYWIGLNKLNDSETWKWADGSVYKQWYKIEDNGNCVYIDKRVMNSAKCEKNKKYICSNKSFCL
uniref:C-type lectin domain family 2 member F-like n=1 Tax=Ictidomys tridecemlineatus TaxID=43179 RepID=UPI001A9FBD30|nr:C-type lectin domain family 2 member F-like [Ictidomys tridecemlineatus]